jgi:hypothetical protein
MIQRRRRTATHNMLRPGYFRFENSAKQTLQGYGDGDFLMLRDEHGKVWKGTAELWDGNLVRFRLRDEDGNHASGVGDTFGIILRDDKGRTWRGIID